MRSLIEQAIIHVINGEDAKADALWHKYMVQRARQIHEALNQGEDVALREGWDDEIAEESYFSEADLDDAEDAPADDGAMGGDDMAADAAADLDADLDSEGDDMGDEPMGDDDMGDDMGGDEPPMDGADMGGEGDLEGKVEDLEGQIEKLTAEFEKMMADMGEESMDDQGDDMGGDEPPMDDAADDMADDDMGGDEPPMDDEGDDMGDEPVDAEADDAEGDDAEGDEEPEEDVPAVKESKGSRRMKEGELPPALKAHMKKKGAAKKEEKVEESDDSEDEMMEDITESVMAELEKVVADLTKDGMEIADGKAITQNTKSPIPQKAPNARDGGGPVKITSKNHEGFEREPAPPVKAGEKRKNTKSGVMDGTSKVPAPPNKDGHEVGNGGTITQNRVSPLARNRNRNSL